MIKIDKFVIAYKKYLSKNEPIKLERFWLYQPEKNQTVTSSKSLQPKVA
ncbi:hypothetical protein Ple7327_0212 [Pleurocapsa sp. PCC 7327]|nr:hypothetical protein Ple7327_0212 [Pleurocapsa sp. PCC 7327]